MNVFAITSDEAETLVKTFLEFNYLIEVEHTVGKAIDPVHLDGASREYLLGACARNTPGFGFFEEGYSWKIASAWNEPVVSTQK